MNSDSWKMSKDAYAMLSSVTESVGEKAKYNKYASDRKLRLFAVACYWQISKDLQDDVTRSAVEIAEKYAEGYASYTELNNAKESVFNSSKELGIIDSPVEATESVRVAHYYALAALMPSSEQAARLACTGNGVFKCYTGKPADLLRCIIPNPFMPLPTIDYTALPDHAIELIVKGMYEKRCFDNMIIVGDILELAGCDLRLTNHCHRPGPHARGCWVMDLVLGKS